MMRRRYILSILTLFLFVASVFGKPVTLAEVREAAYNLLQGLDKDLTIERISARYLPGGELGYYTVDLGAEGWILVSGDDALRPILAFSFENRITPEEEWNDAAAYLLDIYQKEISHALKDTSLPRDARWDRAALPTELKAAAAAPVEPFIEVTWNQNSGWNIFCPFDEAGPGDHAYVGCVAVAMAQAMSVYEYPVKPQGIKSYVHPDYGSLAVNYDLADPYEWDQMSATSSDSFNAMLLYHCAVSVEMDFGPDASGAYVRTATNALTQYFNYSSNLSFHNRFADAEEWVAALVAELEAGRPIIYRGNPEDGSSGHAWNLDGYYASNEVDYFHMNFGWSGSQNGYYTLDAINPGTNDFNSGQGATLGLAPPYSAPYDLELSELTVMEELPSGTYVADVSVADDDPDNTYTFTCKGAYNFLLRDYGPATFYIEDGQLYTDTVFTYDDLDPGSNAEYLLIIVEDQYGTIYEEEFLIEIQKAYHGPEGIALSDSSVQENQPVGTAVGKLVIEDEDSTNSYTYSLFGPYNQATSEFDPASFYVENDTLKTTVVFDRQVSDTCFLMVELVDAHGNQLSRAFTIQIEKYQSGSTGIISIAEEGDLIYPNPADRTITLRKPELKSTLEIYEIATGRKVSVINNVSGTIDVSGFPEGFYLAVIHSRRGIFVQKLMISH